MPAPSPARGSAPTAPRCSRLQRMPSASETIWCDLWPLMLAMKPTPQESFSSERSYRPSAGGRQLCSAAGFELKAADDAPLKMSCRSNSDPLILLVLSVRLVRWLRPAHLRRSAAPSAPRLVLREPDFLGFRLPRSATLENGLACTFPAQEAPNLRCNPRAGFAQKFKTVRLS